MKLVTLENDALRICICPDLGGKIISFYLKERNFELTGTGGKGRLDRKGKDFAPYAFGMDDAFPNIDGERIEWNGKYYDYPDHGEIWRARFAVEDTSVKQVRLVWRSRKFHYLYQKNLELDGNTLYIRYRITKEGGEEFPCFWTWHGLVRYEQDMELLLPGNVVYYQNVLEEGTQGTGKLYPAEKVKRMPKGRAVQHGKILRNGVAGRRMLRYLLPVEGCFLLSDL